MPSKVTVKYFNCWMESEMFVPRGLIDPNTADELVSDENVIVKTKDYTCDTKITFSRMTLAHHTELISYLTLSCPDVKFVSKVISG